MEFKMNSPVWAKMKGFPSWPARIVEPSPNVKAPKNVANYVFLKFFGTADVAWILKKDVTPHSESILQDLKDKKKTKNFQQSIDELLLFLDKTEKDEKSFPTEDDENKSLPTGKDKNKSLPTGKDKNKSLRQRKDKNKSLRQRKDKNKSLLTGKDKNKSLPTGKDVNKSLPKVKGAVRSKKKRLIVKFIKTAPNKCQIVNKEKSRIKRVIKRRPAVKKVQAPDKSLISDEKDNDISEKPNQPFDITYGFMGLCSFGRAVLLKLVSAGVNVFLYDPNIDEVMEYISGIKEITPANSPAELIKICDVTLCCYEADSMEFADILDGDYNIIKGFDDAEKLGKKPGFVQLTNIDLKTSGIIHEAAVAKNAMYLEAPIYGSCEDIPTGEAVINASGHRDLFTKCEKVFALLSNNYFFIGYQIGISSNTNMALNTATGTINAAISETMVLVDRLDLELTDGIVNECIAKLLENHNIPDIVERMGKRTRDTVMPLKNAQKAMEMALMEADKVNQTMPMAAAANEVYKRGKLLNYSDADVSAIYKVIKY